MISIRNRTPYLLNIYAIYIYYSAAYEYYTKKHLSMSIYKERTVLIVTIS